MSAVRTVNWHSELVRGLEAHGVPGAVLLVSDGVDTVTVAAGVTNVNTGIPVTTRTLFQIGSVTKVWTATLVQILCDEGLLNLDDPVAQYIPEVAEAARTFAGFGQITIKQLLNHTSGLQGDMFFDTGRGDDSLERLMVHVAAEPLVFLPGQWMSYSNAAFMVAGRVLEVVSGQTFEELLQAKIVRPLGLTRTETLAERVLLHSAAVGHVHGAGEAPRATDEWQLTRNAGAAGLISTTAEDLHTFLMMHLRDGQDTHGTQILSAERTIEMRMPHAPLPQHIAEMPGEAFGHGWRICPSNETVRVGHNGGTIGQFAFCDTFPDRGGVFILLTNGGAAVELARDLQTLAYPLVAGVKNAPPQGPTSTLIDPEQGRPALGSYVRNGVTIDLEEKAGIWSIVKRDTGVRALSVVTVAELRDGPGGSLWYENPGSSDSIAVLPVTLPDGSRGLQTSGRYYPFQPDPVS